MKKLLTLTSVVIGTTIGVFSQNRSIDFIEGKTFAEVEKMAEEQNKLILVDVFTTWCGPCKDMEKNVFTNDSVADYCNPKFISVRIDAEKGEGKDIAKKYEVQGYPTFLFISPEGKMIHRGYGRKVPKDFIQLMQDVSNPEKQISRLLASSEVKDEKYVTELIKSLKSAGMPVGKVVSDYLASQKDTDLFSKYNWELVRKYIEYIDSRPFKFLVTNYQRFSVLYGDSVVFDKIFYAYIFRAVDLGLDTTRSKEEKFARLENLKQEIGKSNLPKIDKFLAEADMNFYNNAKDWDNLSRVATSGVVEKYYWDRGPSLNHISSVFAEQISDTSVLKKALSWIERSIELEDVPPSNKTHAKLLFKLGEKARAIKIAERALNLAKQFKQPDIEVYEDFLNDLRK